MVYRVIFNPIAEDDIVSIYQFIATDSPDRAIAFSRKIKSYCDSLQTMPHRAPLRETLGVGVRKYVIERKISVLYRVDQDRVHILRVFDAGQNIPETLNM